MGAVNFVARPFCKMRAPGHERFFGCPVYVWTVLSAQLTSIRLRLPALTAGAVMMLFDLSHLALHSLTRQGVAIQSSISTFFGSILIQQCM